ncbi:hypothetical protein HRH25_09890 [Flavisolibacter sp. BT320]|nr:hypothetical protein [Flavisolibacter longurius]
MSFVFNNWSKDLNDDLICELGEKVDFITLPGDRKDKAAWICSTIVSFFSRILLRFVPGHPALLSYTSFKRSWLLSRAVKKYRGKADFVIAHNPGAFFPALQAVKKTGARLGVDVEDYHPGETNEPDKITKQKSLIRHILPVASYCSYASPLIAKEIAKDVPGLSSSQLVILNGFEKTEFLPPMQAEDNSLRFVWFSQYINSNRGLENILAFFESLPPLASLHLIGHMDPTFYERHIKGKNGIVIHPPMAQKALHKFLASCHVGLACDLPVNKNRELALTNKLMAYAQAGLHIVATDTKAQKEFLNDSGLFFTLTDGSVCSYKKVFDRLLIQCDLLGAQRNKQKIVAEKYDSNILYQPLVRILSKSYDGH